MRDALLLAGIWAGSYLGFCAMALSLDRHWAQVMPQSEVPAPVRRRLRALAIACFCAALVVACRHDGPAFGALHWSLSLFAAAMAVAYTLAGRPSALKWLARLSVGSIW